MVIFGINSISRSFQVIFYYHKEQCWSTEYIGKDYLQTLGITRPGSKVFSLGGLKVKKLRNLEVKKFRFVEVLKS